MIYDKPMKNKQNNNKLQYHGFTATMLLSIKSIKFRLSLPSVTE